MNPLVTVIIPNYNHEQFLETRIESVLNQTFKDFEVIILDDCSTDNSKKVIDSFKDNIYVKEIILNDKNSGSTFLQWNKGIEKANGKYIWIAESDDWCEPTLLENLVFQLQSNENISIGFVQSICFDESSSIRFISQNKYLNQVVNGKEFNMNYMLYSNRIVNASMVLFKKNIALNISDEYLTYKYCGDWLFWFLIINNNEVFISGKVLNYFRKHKGDVSSRFLSSGNNFKEELDFTNYLFKMGHIDHYKYVKLVRYRFRYFLSNYFSINVDDRKRLKNSFYETKIVGSSYFILFQFYLLFRKFLRVI